MKILGPLSYSCYSALAVTIKTGLFLLVGLFARYSALAQSVDQIASGLEKHTVVLRNYYTDEKLTFDSDGKTRVVRNPWLRPD